MDIENKQVRVRTRFAPSPTGNLHIGNARIAVLNWLFARRHSGEFILRFDDTDQNRSSESFVGTIKQDLSWLGLTISRQIRQSQRHKLYDKAAETLKRSGRLYPCFDTPQELSIQRKTQTSQGLPPIYDNRKSLSRSDDEIATLIEKGKTPHWRFLLDRVVVSWQDLVKGEVRFESLSLSDPVLIREDGCPLYTFTSVVDDIDNEISHIIRGEDHVTNTATQYQLFEALGSTPPIFAHIPLLLDRDGKPLSKRLDSLSLGKMQENGLFPKTILLYLAHLGTNHTPSADQNLETLIANFDFNNFGKAATCLDENSISSLNQTILQNLSFADARYLLPEGSSEMFWETIRHNVNLPEDVLVWWDILSSDTLKSPYTPQDHDELQYFRLALDLLPRSDWNNETVDQIWQVWQQELKNQSGRKGKSLLLPLRLMLTNLTKGPELASILGYLGHERTKQRLLTTIGSKN